MNSTEMVTTVLGDVPASELGETLTHEHITADYSNFYTVPPYEQFISKTSYRNRLSTVSKEVELYMRCRPHTFGTLGLTNTQFFNILINELKLFRACGGKTILENSNIGIYHNTRMVQGISRITGVNVIIGAGCNLAKRQQPWTVKNQTETIYNKMRAEMLIHCDDYRGAKAGFLGEIGCSWPLEEFEKHSIRATGMLQKELFCSVSFHTEKDKCAPYTILRHYQEAGGDDKRTVMSHVEHTLGTKENILQFLDDNKCYVQIDKFGSEISLNTSNPVDDVMSDAQRIELLSALKEEKKLHRVFISHDIHSADRLRAFGGHGYTHISRNIVPKMLAKGFSKADIDLIRIENPKRWLIGH